jgi:hypothetical protein
MMIRNSFPIFVCSLILAASFPCFAGGQIDCDHYDAMLSNQHSGDRKFSSAEWKSSISSRRSMVYDLAHTIPLIGMSTSEMLSVLGSPLWQTNESAFYLLNLDNVTDVLQLDLKNGSVSKYRVGNHFCRGCSCMHLSKWHKDSSDLMSSEKKDQFLAPSLTSVRTGAGVISLTGGIAIFEDCFSSPNNTPFVSRTWKNTLIRDNNVRYRMLYDLVHSHKLIGMSASSVETLLGKASRKSFSSGSHSLNELNEQGFDEICSYPVLGLNSSCIGGPLLCLVIGYKKNVASAYRLALDPARGPVGTCWEIMGKWQVANLAQGNGGGLSSSSRPSAGN